MVDSGSIEDGEIGLTRYHGRIEYRDGQKLVSIKPDGRHFRGISPQLIRDLQSEYGDDIEIHIF